jgi:lipopolysaccharide transport system permease protein
LEKVIRYTPESKLRHPITFGKQIVSDLFRSRELAWRLLVRDISALYRQTLGGYFWAIFPPLVACGTFILLNSSGILDVKGLKIPYAVYVLLGTILWQVFVESILEPLKVVIEAKPILSRIDFPKEALILCGLGKVLFGFGIKLTIFVAAILLFDLSVEWTVLLLPFPVAGLMLFGTVLGVFLIPFGLLYRDVQHIILLTTSGLIFLTPVAYPPTMGGFFERIVMANPISTYILLAREMVFGGSLENLVPACLLFGLTILLLLIAWIVYRCALPIVVERFGA